MTNVPLYRLSATWFQVAHCAWFFFILSTTLILKIKQYMFTRYMNIDWHLNRTNLYLLHGHFIPTSDFSADRNFT